MTTAFICKCHDRRNQGKAIPDDPGMTEWMLAGEVNEGIVHAFLGSEHLPYRLGSTLRLRIATIRNHCRSMPELPLAVEVHFNSMPGRPSQQGFFCMVEDGCGESKKLTEFILAEMRKALTHSRSRGINRVSETHRWIGKTYEYRDRRLGFLLDTPCPSVLIEAGYLSNPIESEWFRGNANRNVLGRAIGRGILNYLEVKNG